MLTRRRWSVSMDYRIGRLNRFITGSPGAGWLTSGSLSALACSAGWTDGCAACGRSAGRNGRPLPPSGRPREDCRAISGPVIDASRPLDKVTASVCSLLDLPAETPGPASRLSAEQMAKLYAWIVGRDPRQLEFDFGLWTRKIVRDLIRREFRVKLSEVQVGRLLAKMGLSPQRPLYRAYQQDPELVEEWKRVIYPRIRRLAAEEGASSFFQDEASVRTDHHAGTTWAPVGQTPVVTKTGERKAIKMVSAISPKGELRFQVHEGRMNGGRFIEFLKALLGSVPGKIFLIVDGSSVHKAKKVREFVENETDGRLQVFFLPSYSPELNPDEWVWNNVKNDRIGRAVIMSKDDLKARAISALREFGLVARGHAMHHQSSRRFDRGAPLATFPPFVDFLLPHASWDTGGSATEIPG